VVDSIIMLANYQFTQFDSWYSSYDFINP